VLLTALLVAAGLAPPVDRAWTTVDAFYAQVVERQPLGVPEGAARRTLWPFLSVRLQHLLTDAVACERDYARQQPRGSTDKPEYGWLESGLFSGENERATPHAAELVHVEEEGGGRLRAYVRFTYRDPYAGEHPDLPAEYQWYGAAVLAAEHGAWRIDDFLALDDDTLDVTGDVEDVLGGCDRGRWIGYDAWQERRQR
jgi:hypothetical protein